MTIVSNLMLIDLKFAHLTSECATSFPGLFLPPPPPHYPWDPLGWGDEGPGNKVALKLGGNLVGSITSRCSGKWARAHSPLLSPGEKSRTRGRGEYLPSMFMFLVSHCRLLSKRLLLSVPCLVWLVWERSTRNLWKEKPLPWLQSKLPVRY